MTVTRKILIVEDEETILELCSVILEYEDYELFYARDGEKALRIARMENPDVILLDIQIPKRDGYEVCNSIKSDSATSHIKVLMLSGMTQEYNRRKAQEVGADGYITKPFNSAELVKTVEGILRND